MNLKFSISHQFHFTTSPSHSLSQRPINQRGYSNLRWYEFWSQRGSCRNMEMGLRTCYSYPIINMQVLKFSLMLLVLNIYLACISIVLSASEIQHHWLQKNQISDALLNTYVHPAISTSIKHLIPMTVNIPFSPGHRHTLTSRLCPFGQDLFDFDNSPALDIEMHNFVSSTASLQIPALNCCQMSDSFPVTDRDDQCFPSGCDLATNTPKVSKVKERNHPEWWSCLNPVNCHKMHARLIYKSFHFPYHFTAKNKTC